jgi:hypothetical protein
MPSLLDKLLYFLRLRRKELTSRPINGDEVSLARQIFEEQLPYEQIHIANFYLPGNEGVPVTVKSLTDYTIYFGPTVFRDGAQTPGIRNTFIHELTHVWQGHHSAISWEYMADSLLAQGRALIEHGDRNKAYDFVAGEPWDSYNVEQQANIVENWFANGMNTSDPLYVYITDNIRAGRA